MEINKLINFTHYLFLKSIFTVLLNQVFFEYFFGGGVLMKFLRVSNQNFKDILKQFKFEFEF
jgi:hypothetical protein